MKKSIICAICLTLLFGFASYNVYKISISDGYAQIVNSQNNSQISLYKSRGTIYDCNLNKITNSQKELLAVAMPISENFDDITKNVGISYEDILSSNKPISYFTKSQGSLQFIDYFNVYKNNSDNLIAQHIIGYTDSSNNGVTGAELAFNDILTQNQGELSLTYKVNALGQIIVGDKPKYNNTLGQDSTGVALTIDNDIQLFVQKVCEKMEKGSVVICDTKTGQIKASVSMPSYDPNKLPEYLDDENSALINRSFLSYAPGSVFKLLMAAYAIENNIEEDYTCTGSIDVNGRSFTCNNSKAHGDTNLHLALQKSCNCYFINLTQKFNIEEVLNMAIKMGLGQETEFYENLISVSGNIPTKEELSNARSLANFSIGQGTVLTSPVQIAQIINCIVNYGEFQKASLYLGKVNEFKELEEYKKQEESYSVMSPSTANTLMKYMQSTAKFGTARSAAPAQGICGIKTGTAQLGIYDENQNELCNNWYAGFVGKSSAEYSVVVLTEGGLKSQSNSAQIFKEIAEFLVNNC